MVRLALALSLVAGCRVGFDRVPSDAAGDAGPPPVLPCAAPPHFALGGTAAAVAATATATGYYAFVVDGVGDVHGSSYRFDGGELVAGRTDVVYSGATIKGAAAAAIPVGDQVLLATLYGQPDPAGLVLVPRGADLADAGGPRTHAGWFGLDGTIARAPDGALALLGVQSNLDVEVELVAQSGAEAGAEHVMVDRGEAVNSAAITAADGGFLLTWSASAPSPNQIRAVRLDPALAATALPTTINTGAMFDGNDPRAAYAPAASRYLFAWWQKPSNDEVWVSLRDDQLTEITAVRLSAHGKSPRVIAGDGDFLVVWQDDSYTSGLAAARVGFDGRPSLLTVPADGKALGWDLVTRAGQPALIWLQDGPPVTLRLDPLCN